MRNKNKSRKRAQRAKLAAHSFSQFVETTNLHFVGRSPSVLPVMEDLLRKPFPPSSTLPEKPVENKTEEGSNYEFQDEADSEIDYFPLKTAVEKIREAHSRSVLRLPSYTIPLALIIIVSPVFLVCLAKLQTHDLSENTRAIQSKQAAPVENQFIKTMEAGYISGEIGDYDEAIACYGQAALQPMTLKDKLRLYSALRVIEKKVPSNPNIQIALCNYFETNGQFVEAQEAYAKAIRLSTGDQIPPALERGLIKKRGSDTTNEK